MAAREGPYTREIIHTLTLIKIVSVYIASYCRTPLGAAFTGSLSHLTAPELASFAIKGIIKGSKKQYTLSVFRLLE